MLPRVHRGSSASATSFSPASAASFLSSSSSTFPKLHEPRRILLFSLSPSSNQMEFRTAQQHIRLSQLRVDLTEMLQNIFGKSNTASDLVTGLNGSRDHIALVFKLKLCRHYQLHKVAASTQMMAFVCQLLKGHERLRETIGSILFDGDDAACLPFPDTARRDQEQQPDALISAALSTVVGQLAVFDVLPQTAAAGEPSVQVLNAVGASTTHSFEEVFSRACRLWWLRYLVLRKPTIVAVMQKKQPETLRQWEKLSQWALAVLSSVILAIILARVSRRGKPPFHELAWNTYWYKLVLYCASLATVLDAVHRLAQAAVSCRHADASSSGVDFLRRLKHDDIDKLAANLNLMEISQAVNEVKDAEEATLLTDDAKALESVESIKVMDLKSRPTRLAPVSNAPIVEKPFSALNRFGARVLHPDVARALLQVRASVEDPQLPADVSSCLQKWGLISFLPTSLRYNLSTGKIRVELFCRRALPSSGVHSSVAMAGDCELANTLASILARRVSSSSSGSSSSSNSTVTAADFEVSLTFEPVAHHLQGQADAYCRRNHLKVVDVKSGHRTCGHAGTVSFLFEFKNKFWMVSTGHTQVSSDHRHVLSKLLREGTPNHDVLSDYLAHTLVLTQLSKTLQDTIETKVAALGAVDKRSSTPAVLSFPCLRLHGSSPPVKGRFNREASTYKTSKSYDDDLARICAEEDATEAGRAHCCYQSPSAIQATNDHGEPSINDQLDVSAALIHITNFRPQDHGYLPISSNPTTMNILKAAHIEVHNMLEHVPPQEVQVTLLRSRHAVVADTTKQQNTLARTRNPLTPITGTLSAVFCQPVWVDDRAPDLSSIRKLYPQLADAPDTAFPSMELNERVQLSAPIGTLPGDCGSLIMAEDHKGTRVPLGYHQFLSTPSTGQGEADRYILTGVNVLFPIEWLLREQLGNISDDELHKEPFQLWIKSSQSMTSFGP